MKQPVVEGGCTQDPLGTFGGKPPKQKQLTKEELERIVARSERIAAIMSCPWRTLRRVLPKTRPGA